MEKAVIDAYIKAGKIASKAREYAKSLCGAGVLALDVAEKVESKIRELGGGLAFPVDVSINEVAAHYTPGPGDKLVLKKGDLVKVDIGVQIDGYIADTMVSVSIGPNKENEVLIAAAEAALAAALKVLRPGVTLGEIGAAVSGSLAGSAERSSADSPSASGVKIIKNLSGHGVSSYLVHDGLTVPNFDTGNKNERRDCAIAIEPFTTYGDGLVVDAQPSGIYRVERKKPVRVGREVLDYVWRKYRTLPFSLRELVKQFGSLKARLAVRSLKASGVIKEYNVLRERAKRKVGQAEHTVLILDDKVVVTTK